MFSDQAQAETGADGETATLIAGALREKFALDALNIARNQQALAEDDTRLAWNAVVLILSA